MVPYGSIAESLRHAEFEIGPSFRVFRFVSEPSGKLALFR